MNDFQEKEMSDDSTIRELQQKWFRATLDGDIAAICELMTEDIVFLTPGKPPFGRLEFIESFAKAKEQVAIKCDGEYEEIVIAGNFAHARARLEVTVTPKNGGAPKRLEGYTLSVFRQSTDQSWRLCRDANMLVPKSS